MGFVSRVKFPPWSKGCRLGCHPREGLPTWVKDKTWTKGHRTTYGRRDGGRDRQGLRSTRPRKLEVGCDPHDHPRDSRRAVGRDDSGTRGLFLEVPGDGRTLHKTSGPPVVRLELRRPDLAPVESRRVLSRETCRGAVSGRPERG